MGSIPRRPLPKAVKLRRMRARVTAKHQATTFGRNNRSFGMKPISSDDFRRERRNGKLYKISKGTVYAIK